MPPCREHRKRSAEAIIITIITVIRITIISLVIITTVVIVLIIVIIIVLITAIVVIIGMAVIDANLLAVSRAIESGIRSLRELRAFHARLRGSVGSPDISLI